MSENKIELSGIFSDGYGVNPKKLWKMKLGTINLENKKKVKGIYVKAVLSYMLSYTGGGKNECFPSIRTIAEDLEISADIVVNAINGAVQLKMIDKKQMFPNDPLKHNNKYILNFLNKLPNIDVRQSRITCADGTNFEVVTVEQNNNIYNNNSINNNRFKKPTLKEIQEYSLSINFPLNAERFIDYYESNGWKVGRNKMKDWKAAVRTWRGNNFKDGNAKMRDFKIEAKLKEFNVPKDYMQEIADACTARNITAKQLNPETIRSIYKEIKQRKK